MNRPTNKNRSQLRRPTGDDGSTIPLILGFFLIGLLFTGAAVALSDAFTKQRDLQSTCDGAALAAANQISSSAARSGLDDAVPIGSVEDTVSDYLSRDPNNQTIRTSGTLSEDGTTVELTCTQHNRVAFGALILRPNGVDQRVEANARSRITP